MKLQAMASRARTQGFAFQCETTGFSRSDLLSLASLSALWIVMSALVNPIGNFPLNDDWIYALGARSILETGRFELPSTGAPNVLAQAYWGALFCLPFGFSFTALRFSTLTLGWAGIIAFYLLLREVGGNWWIALVGGLALAVNPLYFGLAHTFMTDVPFVALVIIALCLFVRGVRREERLSLLAGIAIALVAILIRQFALLLLIAFGVAYILRRGVAWKTLVIAIVPVVLGAGLHVFYQRWMIDTGRKPFFELTSPEHFSLDPFPICLLYSVGLSLSFPYLGFFLAPFLTSVTSPGTYSLEGNRRLRMCLLIMILAVVLIVARYDVYPASVPGIGHILTPSGLGPRTLKDTYVMGRNLALVPASMNMLWIGAIIVGSIGAVSLLLHFVHAAARVFKGLQRPGWRSAIWLEALTLVFVCAYGSLIFLVGYGFKTALFDRYILVVIPAVFVLVLVSEIRLGFTTVVPWRGALSLVFIVIYAAISVAATHDYLAWNRTRWIATDILMQSGVSLSQIDGGYEFDGWYFSDINHKRAPDKNGWWVEGDEYIIAAGPLSGYRELRRIGFRRWLPLADASVVILRRAEPENR